MTFVPARSLAFAAAALSFSFVAGISATSALAQALPPGSYQQSCRQLHWSGTTLVAECRKSDGNFSGTGLPNALRCRGDIADIDGRLQCVAANAPPPAGPPPRGPAPDSGYPPPAPGYAPPPGSGGYDDRQARCEQLWHRAQELRDRLQYATFGEEHDRLEDRLHETHEDRERLGCGH